MFNYISDIPMGHIKANSEFGITAFTGCISGSDFFNGFIGNSDAWMRRFEDVILMQPVLGSGYIFQIAQAVVCSNPVDMVDFHAIGIGADESKHDQFVNSVGYSVDGSAAISVSTINSDTHDFERQGTYSSGASHSGSWQSPYSANIAGFVPSISQRDWTPDFISDSVGFGHDVLLEGHCVQSRADASTSVRFAYFANQPNNNQVREAA